MPITFETRDEEQKIIRELKKQDVTEFGDFVAPELILGRAIMRAERRLN